MYKSFYIGDSVLIVFALAHYYACSVMDQECKCVKHFFSELILFTLYHINHLIWVQDVSLCKLLYIRDFELIVFTLSHISYMGLGCKFMQIILRWRFCTNFIYIVSYYPCSIMGVGSKFKWIISYRRFWTNCMYVVSYYPCSYMGQECKFM